MEANNFNLGELTSREKGLRLIQEFLKDNKAEKSFNKKQRIILIASEFDIQTESAVAWLISNNVDISCFTMKPVRLNNNLYLETERILPPPMLEDYYVNIQSSEANDKSEIRSRVERSIFPKMDKLFEWGLVKEGDRLHIKNREQEVGIAIDHRYVDVNGEKMTYNSWGKKVTDWSAIQVYTWIVKEDVKRTLDELRQEKISELEQQNDNE